MDTALDTLSIVNKLNLVHIDITCPSGAVCKTDRGNHNDNVFTDGTVRYVDRKLLAPFASARNTIARICRGMGTAFLGQWAISDERLSEAETEISNAIDAFNAAKSRLAVKLPVKMLDWRQAHPEVAPYIGRFPSDTDVLDGISIHAAVYKINPANSGLMSSADDNAINHAVGGLADQVLREVAQDAKDAFSENANKATAKARNVLERIGRKLQGLMFVDTKLAAVAYTIDHVLAFLPAQGEIRGMPFVVYTGVMRALMDPTAVVSLCESSLAFTSGGDWSAFGAPPISPEPVTPGVPEVPATVQASATDDSMQPGLVIDNGHGVVTVEPPSDAAPALLPPPPPAAQHGPGDWSW